MGSPEKDAPFEAFHLDELSFDERYRLLTGSVVPRPIAFVSSLNHDGSVNAAPFSSFMIVSVEAALLAFSIGKANTPKVTLANIRRTREFVINTVPEALARQVQFCGEQTGGEDKLSAAGLSAIPSQTIGSPRVGESKIQFECRLETILNFGESHLVVGKVELMHAQRGLVRESRIDPLDYAPLGRIAGRAYCTVREILSL